MSMIISIYNIKKKTHTHQLLKGKKYKVHRFLMISKRKFNGVHVQVGFLSLRNV